MTDEIDKDPNAAFVGLENTVVLFKTGDPEVDRVKEKLARGEEVDLIKEWMDDEDQEKFRQFYEKKNKQNPGLKEPPKE